LTLVTEAEGQSALFRRSNRGYRGEYVQMGKALRLGYA